MPFKAVTLAIAVIALGAFFIACTRAVRRSRALQRRYRESSPAERAVLEARAQTEPELAEYMFPVPAFQVAIAMAGVALLVWAKFGGLI